MPPPRSFDPSSHDSAPSRYNPETRKGSRRHRERSIQSLGTLAGPAARRHADHRARRLGCPGRRTSKQGAAEKADEKQADPKTQASGREERDVDKPEPAVDSSFNTVEDVSGLPWLRSLAVGCAGRIRVPRCNGATPAPERPARTDHPRRCVRSCSAEPWRSWPASPPASPAPTRRSDMVWTPIKRATMREARETWLPIAEAGHGPAQRNLGVLYYLGQDVEQDLRGGRAMVSSARPSREPPRARSSWR